MEIIRKETNGKWAVYFKIRPLMDGNVEIYLRMIGELEF